MVSFRVPNFHDLIKRLENLSNIIAKCSNLFDFKTDRCAACHTFILHVHACRKLNRLCISVDVIFSVGSPFFGGDLGQELFR